MNRIMLGVALAGLIVCLAACNGTTDAESASHPEHAAGPEAAPRILREWTGMRSSVGEPSCSLIISRAAWAEEWKRAGQSSSTLPEVDFKSVMIVAAFHGDDRAHHSMEGTLRPDAGGLVLTYDLFSTSGERSPDVRPFGFYSIPRTQLPIRIESHHVHGPSQPVIAVLGTVELRD